MVRDRPAVDHHHADDHLALSRLVVTAVAVSRERLGAVALEVGGGHIVEGKIDLQGEQIAQSKVELLLDLLFVRVQLVQGAIPPLELSRFDSDPRRLTPPTLLVVAPAGDPAAAFAVAQVSEVGTEMGGFGRVAEVSLSSDSTLLQPDSTDLAQFAREAGLVLREIERIAQEPRVDSFELVQEDILNSGMVEGIAQLTELTSDRRDRTFLRDCEYLLMRVVKVESTEFIRGLPGLISEIRRLNLIETARLIEMEGGRSQWLAGL